MKRDFEYLLRLWETVRDFTLKSTAPTLVYEEGSLIKRSIRDLYNKDVEEILVAGEEGHREARDFMRMLMPSHAKNVKLYKDTQPVFTRYGIESQLDAMFTPTVQLRSGGYIVINQTEALVAIDVNSGRATREHHIEDTALKTNLEASEEIARQLRLRDLAGLIVIDFIDMDEGRNNRLVERRLKESLKNDRARIQVGRISHFGLMEMSRQRIRSSVLESSTDKCPHCGGTGHVRSVSSVALHLLRMIEEMLLKGATHNLIVRTRTRSRALCAQSQARASARAGKPLPDRHHGERRRDGRRRAALPDREGRAGALGRGRQGDRGAGNAACTCGARAGGGHRRRGRDRRGAKRRAKPRPPRAAEEPADAEGEQRDEPRRGRGRRRRGRGGRGSREEFTHETAAEPAVAHEGNGEAAPEVGGRRVPKAVASSPATRTASGAAAGAAGAVDVATGAAARAKALRLRTGMARTTNASRMSSMVSSPRSRTRSPISAAPARLKRRPNRRRRLRSRSSRWRVSASLSLRRVSLNRLLRPSPLLPQSRHAAARRYASLRRCFPPVR